MAKIKRKLQPIAKFGVAEQGDEFRQAGGAGEAGEEFYQLLNHP